MCFPLKSQPTQIDWSPTVPLPPPPPPPLSAQKPTLNWQ